MKRFFIKKIAHWVHEKKPCEKVPYVYVYNMYFVRLCVYILKRKFNTINFQIYGDTFFSELPMPEKHK